MPAIPDIQVKSGYRPQAEDKTVEADALEFYLLRQKTTEVDRLEMAASLTRNVKALALWGIRQANPNAPIEQVRQVFASVLLEHKLGVGFNLTGVDETLWTQDSIAVAAQLHPLFASLEIPYYITRGVASAAYGEPRSTKDLDLVIQIQAQDITRLSAVLEQQGFYCPPGAIEEIQQGVGKVLSVTHTETIDNVDLVLSGDSEFDRVKLQRRRQLRVRNVTELWLISPEDLILGKILWGQGKRSEKQWRDVLGVLKVQAANLDYGYLAEWSEQLGIADMLSQALVEAGI
jgi:hypothetical protein